MLSSTRNLLVVLAVLLLCVSAEAAVFTAGGGGTYSTIQEAVAAAVAAGGDNHIKIRAGTYDEELFIVGMTSGSLTFLGGWNAFFTSRNPDPSSTVIHSTGGNPAASLDYSVGAVRFDGMTFTGDNSYDNGGAIYALLTGTAQLFLDHCVITGSSAAGVGGGGYIKVAESSGFEIWDCEISNNLSLLPTSVAGGGLYLSMNGFSTTGKITWSTIENNALQTAGSSNAGGGGIYLSMYGGQFEMSDCLFSNNTLGTANGDREGSEMFLNVNGSPDTTIVQMRRNRFHSSSSIGASDMVHVFTNGDVETTITDSWFSGGAGTGIFGEYYNAGTLIINNITVADFSGTGIWVDTTGDEDLVSLTNSIVWTSGSDWVLPAGSAISGNVVGVNPLFVDPAGRNFRLQEGSPAIDTSSGSPIGGFSITDLHGLNRLIGSAVDAGGSEWGGLFADSFEVGTTRVWAAEQ